MTDVVDAPSSRQADQPLDRRARRTPGSPAAPAPVYNPATGEQSGAVDFATRRGGRPRRPGREGRRSRRGARCRSRSAPSSSSRSASSFHEQREEIAKLLTAEHGKVLSDAMGEVDARARGDRVLLRHPAPAEGRHDRAGVDRRRRLLDPPAARRRRRHHAVQLPGDGARCGCGRRRSRAATRSCSSRPRRIRRRRSARPSCSKEAGVPDGVFNVVHGDKVAVDALLEHPGHRRDLVRRLDADRAVRLRDGDRERQALPGARRREEPHDRAARRRHRHGGRRGGLGRRTARPASAAWRSRWSSRSATSPIRSIEAIKAADPEGQGRRRHGRRDARWAR